MIAQSTRIYHTKLTSSKQVVRLSFVLFLFYLVCSCWTNKCHDLLSSYLASFQKQYAIAIEMPEQHRSVEEYMYRRCTRTRTRT